MNLHPVSHLASEIIVRAGGIIGTASDTNNQLLDFVKNAGVTVVVIMFIWSVHKKAWAFGAIVSALLVGAAVLFGLNGGLQWAAGLWQQQFGG